MRLIESDVFPFEFLSELAEHESWRKEVHRPIYHIHKWWATRLGSVFRGILISCQVDNHADLQKEFYKFHNFKGVVVFDPFMGAGTTIGEAHKLGFSALGRDINPVAANTCRVAFGPLNRANLESAYERLSRDVGERIRGLYQSTDEEGKRCDVLYYFWIMQVSCLYCGRPVDLFPSYTIAQNAYPNLKPQTKVLCPSCGDIFDGIYNSDTVTCPSCFYHFNPSDGVARGSKAKCRHCGKDFAVIEAIAQMGKRPDFRLIAKLVLTQSGNKLYLPPSERDFTAYTECGRLLQKEIAAGNIVLPKLELEDGYNTRQAISYNFRKWSDFFNDRQLLALAWLQSAILQIEDAPTRDAFLTLFSGVLEFNNLFASYKGEGTGAVRPIFAHHILKPERMPIEANVWGTPKSSGSFSNLFRSRLLRALDYRLLPTEIDFQQKGKKIVCSPAFSETISRWPFNEVLPERAISISCGDSSFTGLPDRSIDLIVTDPPFFDNVHYSELADFFYAWQQLTSQQDLSTTTRSNREVQDTNPERFASKLASVFSECYRVLKDDGLLVFTYHHSRKEGWSAIARAIMVAGFVVINAHPVKSEMSVAIPKSQAREPIHFDIIIVCRKRIVNWVPATITQAVQSAESKISRLLNAGFHLSENDRKAVIYGQLLTTLENTDAASQLEERFVQINRLTCAST
ncbi:MAG: DNA methyltransferase [Candidatus Methanomethylicaceae archaeon]